MRRLSAVVAVGLLASLLSGTQATTPATAADTPARTTLQGVVTDADTGNPVPGACITLHKANAIYGYARSHPLAHVCADASGAYQIADAPLNYAQTAYVEADGYGVQWYPANGEPLYAGSFTATAAPITTKNIVLHRATAGLSLHLTRQDGSPAAYASVQLLVPGKTGYASLLRADANGMATRTNLPAGQYKIQISGAGYASQFYPARKTVDEGDLVTLTAGSTLSLQEQFLAVDPMPAVPATVTLTGTVRSPNGTPIAGATISALIYLSTIEFGSGTTDADGHYTISGLPNVGGLIRVSAPGYATVWNGDDPLPLLIQNIFGTRDFVLRPGSGTIRGKLTDSVPGPIPVYTSVEVASTDGTWTYTAPVVGYDGTYEIPNVPAGTYTIAVSANGRVKQWLPYSSTAAGAVPVTVTDGQVTVADANLLAPGRVKLQVVDDLTGQPVVGATVWAYGSTMPNTQMRTTDAQGRVEFGDFWRSDTVTISAVDNPGHFDSASVHVSVAPGEPTPATIRMRPGAVLSVPADGLNPGYLVCAYLFTATKPDPVQADCEAPQAGRVTLGPFEAGTYQAFLKPSAMAGAQWLADAGGSGEQRTATVLRLTAGQALTAPAQHFGPVGSIGGTITNSANNATASGCVSIPPSVLDVYCITPGGGYRITGLGPYAWPVHFTGYAASPTVWAGNAMSRLDAQLITVPPGQMATYDFVLPQIGSFAVSGPSASTYWRLDAFDAQTGDYAGSVNDYSIGRGPVLLRFNVYSGDGSTVSSCWLWHPQVPGRIASGVFYPGTAGQPAPLKITPGRNCRPEQPPLVLTNGANQMRGQMVSMAGPSQPHGNAPSLSKTASLQTPAPAAVTTQAPAQTFNELVHNSFDAALQLAVGVLP